MSAIAMPSTVAIPTLDDLARDPSLAGALPRHAAAALVAAGLVAVSAAAGRLLALSTEPDASPRDLGREAGPETLTAAGVEALFGLSARWLEDHGRALDLHRIRHRPSRKMVLYHVGRLRRFIEAAACRA